MKKNNKNQEFDASFLNDVKPFEDFDTDEVFSFDSSMDPKNEDLNNEGDNSSNLDNNGFVSFSDLFNQSENNSSNYIEDEETTVSYIEDESDGINQKQTYNEENKNDSVITFSEDPSTKNVDESTITEPTFNFETSIPEITPNQDKADVEQLTVVEDNTEVVPEENENNNFETEESAEQVGTGLMESAFEPPMFEIPEDKTVDDNVENPVTEEESSEKAETIEPESNNEEETPEISVGDTVVAEEDSSFNFDQPIIMSNEDPKLDTDVEENSDGGQDESTTDEAVGAEESASDDNVSESDTTDSGNQNVIEPSVAVTEPEINSFSFDTPPVVAPNIEITEETQSEEKTNEEDNTQAESEFNFDVPVSDDTAQDNNENSEPVVDDNKVEEAAVVEENDAVEKNEEVETSSESTDDFEKQLEALSQEANNASVMDENVTSDINNLFVKVNSNVKEASDIFLKNVEMKKKIDDRFEELKQLQVAIEKSKKNDYDEINEYKEKVINELKERKQDVETRLNNLKELQSSLSKEKEEFENYKRDEKMKLEDLKRESEASFESHKDELEKLENKLRKQKNALDEERRQLSLDQIQYESDKNELANNMLKFNDIVGTFTNGMDKLN